MLRLPNDKNNYSKSTTSLQRNILSTKRSVTPLSSKWKGQSHSPTNYNSFEFEDISFSRDDSDESIDSDDSDTDNDQNNPIPLLKTSTESANGSTPDLFAHHHHHHIGVSKKTKTRSKPTDILARESDVFISAQITPLTEYKGFILYLVSAIFYTFWLLWSFLPKKWLNLIGIYYYPSRWWSLSISSFVLMLMLYIYIALQLWNIEYETVRIDDLRTVIDDDAVVEKDAATFGWQSTNGVYDLRITDANEILYD